MNTSSVRPRSPVLVGAGQFQQRPDEPSTALEVVAMMAETLERAADDAGSRALLGAATDIWVVNGAWKYSDPGRLLAERFGAAARTGLSTDGGNTPQWLVNEASRRIQAGDADIVMIVGAEGIWSRRRARRVGERVPYTDQTDVEPDERLGRELAMSNTVEEGRGFNAPVVMYPIFESAIRAARGESIADHRRRVAELWSGFNEVAVANEYAWLRRPMNAAEILSPDDGNRMVGFPYTKAMNSNWDLDQAAGVIVCSADAARRHGVATDRWVFPHAGTSGADTDDVSNRWDLGRSPAIRHAGARLFELAGVGPDDLAHVDLYSCFPSAVQISASELGLDLDRQLTVTGGLTFAGGPLNNYVSHSIATMAGVLRADPGSLGLVTANGGYITKHALGIYSTEPPAGDYVAESCQERIDAEPRRDLDSSFTGEAEIEAYTVMHDADGPVSAQVALRTPEGARQWATSTVPDLLTAMMTDEHVGRPAIVSPDYEVSPT